MDGRVLTEAFTSEFNAANPINIQDVDLSAVGQDGGVSAAEEALVMEKLRDLGYVA